MARRLVGTAVVVMFGFAAGLPAAAAPEPDDAAGVEGGIASVTTVARPLVTGPASGGFGPMTLQADLSQLPDYGYVQEEFFVEGSASAFTPLAPLGTDGQWSVAPGATAAYKTRILVRRPADAARFNGTVVVEWLNVTAGFDTSPDWQYGRVQLMRTGAIWVGVSAQAVGVQGAVAGLKTLDPARYGTLTHPGDDFSYDLYSQVGRALQRPRGVDPLAGMRPRVLIADGESQSASRMVTYINAVAPLARIYDGYLVHSRSAGASAIASIAAPQFPMPTVAFIRTDLGRPVLVFEAETDVVRHLPARQDDSPTYRLWEVAGTSHVDAYMLGEGAIDFLGCTADVNRGPQHYVFHTALRDLRRWIRRPWLAPPSAPRITFDAAGQIVRAADGNALGGIRMPQLDVPVATLSGFGNTPGFCSLAGTTTPFTVDQLTARYGDRNGYLYQYLVAEASALDSRFLMRADAWDALLEAVAVSF